MNCFQLKGSARTQSFIQYQPAEKKTAEQVYRDDARGKAMLIACVVVWAIFGIICAVTG